MKLFAQQKTKEFTVYEISNYDRFHQQVTDFKQFLIFTHFIFKTVNIYTLIDSKFFKEPFCTYSESLTALLMDTNPPNVFIMLVTLAVKRSTSCIQIIACDMTSRIQPLAYI